MKQFSGDARGALRHGREVLRIADEHGFALRRAEAVPIVAWAAVVTGEPDPCTEAMSATLDAMQQSGVSLIRGYYCTLAAEVLRLQRRVPEALAVAKDAWGASLRTGELWYAPRTLKLVAELLAECGEQHEADLFSTQGAELLFSRGVRHA
ncbi:MAG: hypothetical protein IPK26_02600 [Planctomycetes bacterium]|nr:hypothetical protein [Planctomycetota bacterium]